MHRLPKSAGKTAGTDGFEFVELPISAPGRTGKAVSSAWAIRPWPGTNQEHHDLSSGRHHYILNAERRIRDPFRTDHGPAHSMAWRVVDAKHAFEHAVKLGAEPYAGSDQDPAVPAIKGIGGSLSIRRSYGAKVHPMTWNSVGSGSVIQSRRGWAFTISTI